MPDVTYYFNAYVTPVWVNPNNLVDGDAGTFAASEAKKTEQLLTGNTCPGTDLGTITRVQIRAFAYGDGNDRLDITPVFTGGDGDIHETVPVVDPGGWSAYVDITNDTNHPDWSLWSHIQDLDCIIDNVAVSKGNIMYASKVEIKVSIDVIYVGADPIPRANQLLTGNTNIDKNNPAKGSGILDSVQLYTRNGVQGLTIGTFYTTNGNTLKCRDSVYIGNLSAGFREITGLSLEIVVGDFIGNYLTGGSIDSNLAGFDGVWWLSGDYTNPDDEAEYTFESGQAVSLMGYGAAVAPTITTQAVDDILPTTATGNVTIANTGGEDCSKRGICWSTSPNPTVANDKSEETDSFGVGAFERPMTGLLSSTHYYAKGYAYNSIGYGYGNQVEFDTAWEPPVSEIDVGADPIDREATIGTHFTTIDRNNPANASGTLHTIQVFAATNITDLRVGTFYLTSGFTLKCRDSVLIGAVEAGALRTITEDSESAPIALTVEASDYIGFYMETGTLERSLSGDGYFAVFGEFIDPNDETEYTYIADKAVSLYGYGDIGPPAVTIPRHGVVSFQVPAIV